MTEIKRLSEADAKAASEIEGACFSKPWSEETLATELKNPLNDFFGVFEGERLLGYIGMQSVSGETSVFNAAVLKEYRRKGFGEALVRQLVEEAEKRGSETVFLEVRSGNLPAISLYEKLGFVFCGLRKNYYSDPTENAFLMKRVLKGEQETEDSIECWE